MNDQVEWAMVAFDDMSAEQRMKLVVYALSEMSTHEIAEAVYAARESDECMVIVRDISEMVGVEA